MNKILTLSAILLMMLSSCSSPESDAEMLAQEECDMWDSYAKDINQTYTNFIKEFSNNDYQTRAEAREALQNHIDEVEARLQSRLNELDEKYTELLEKYREDQDKMQLLSNTYNNIVGTYSVDTTKVAGLRTQAYNKILTIIPLEPDIEKIRKDLVGRVIRALPGGYFSNYWSWTIQQGEIKDLQITEIQNIDARHKEYSVDMTLQSTGAAYKVNGKVFYVLDDGDDWEIDMLEPSDIVIVNTGRYNNSIKAVLYDLIMGHQLSIHNNSDAPLLVGFSLIDYRGIRSKHSLLVGGGRTQTYSDFGIEDYTIDFVERP